MSRRNECEKIYDILREREKLPEGFDRDRFVKICEIVRYGQYLLEVDRIVEKYARKIRKQG